jgi:antitoxin component of MazEF toxin-antitoxin module
MTLIVKSSSEDTISLPAWLMKLLNLREGDEIKTIIEGQTIRLTPLDQFLSLRGALREDDAFDTAIEFLNQGWKSWAMPASVPMCP